MRFDTHEPWQILDGLTDMTHPYLKVSYKEYTFPYAVLQRR